MSETKKSPSSIEDIIGSAKAAERTVTLCLRGDLNAQHEDAERELRAVQRDWVQSTLNDVSPAQELASKLVKIEDEMRANEHTFRFRALSGKGFSDLVAAHPPREGEDEQWNLDTFVPGLIAGCCIEPAMTVEQAGSLMDVLNQAQRDALFTAAWSVNTRSADVPFSVLASSVLRDTEQK